MFTTPVINVRGQSVKTPNVFKYLGVVLDSTLSFNDHIEHLRKALSKVLGVFSRARPRPLGNALKTMCLVIFRITSSYATSIFITITQERVQIFFWKKYYYYYYYYYYYNYCYYGFY